MIRSIVFYLYREGDILLFYLEQTGQIVWFCIQQKFCYTQLKNKGIFVLLVFLEFLVDFVLHLKHAYLKTTRFLNFDDQNWFTDYRR